MNMFVHLKVGKQTSSGAVYDVSISRPWEAVWRVYLRTLLKGAFISSNFIRADLRHSGPHLTLALG
jgi:hypothetical protein